MCGLRPGKKLHSLAAGDILMEVKHVKAHRTKKEKKETSHFEKFVTGSEKADDPAKAGAIWDEGFMAETRAKPQERWAFVEKKSENTMHRTEWRVEANKYQCMRCGRGSKEMKMPEKCTGPKLLSKSLEKW